MNTKISFLNQLNAKSDIWVVRLFAAMVVIGAFIYSFFMDRPLVFDELGLHNPIYMYLQYGKMTYPVHLYFDYMIVHPPYHYWLIAVFMKTGLNLLHAAGVPIFLFTLLTVYLITTGNFTARVKIGLLVGFFCTIFIWADFYTIRPDLHLTVAWIAGLIALESARLAGWHTPRLVLGSFLATYASGVHYWGAPAFGVILVYAAWMVKELGFSKAGRKVIGMVLGACLFGVPYLLIFVLPNWENIRKLTAQVQDMGGPNALQTHLYSYEVLSKRLADSWSARPLTTLLTYPVLQFKIPAILIATAILLTQPCTRGLAIGGLILPSFVLLFSRHKAIGYTGYYTPEFLLYMVALVIGAIALVELLVKRLLRDNWQSVATWAAAIALAIPVFTSIPTTLGFEQARLTPRMDDLDVGRAAGRELLGPNALMPYISGSHWYTAGSDRWYPAQSDLSYPKYTQMDWQAYLAQFEAVAVDDSHWNFNTRAIPVPQWYVQGKLSLRGFFLNNRHSEKATLSSPLAQFICGESGQAKGEPSKSGDRCTFIDYAKPEGSLSYLFLDEKRPTQVIGYGYARDGQLYRFEEENNGEYLFFSGVCASDREPDQTISFFLTFPLDQVGYTNPHVINAILPYQRYSIARQTFLAGCKPREEIRGRLQTVDKQALLEKLSKEDQPIQFFRTLEAAQNGSQEPSTR